MGAHQRNVVLAEAFREIAALLIEGLTSKLIGKRLGVSPRTVDVYRARLMRKYASATTAELVHKMLAQAGKKAFIGANFGVPLSRACLEKFDVLVLDAEVDADTVARVVKALADAERPVLYAGGGVLSADATREHFGVAGAARPGLFVVHKHAATRLHYDVRIEIDGLGAIEKEVVQEPVREQALAA